MKNSNPFVPQGSILEQQNKRRSRLKLAVFCVLTVSVVGLSVMLIQGCKREQPVDTDVTTPTIDTNLMTSVDTNPPVADTNPPVVEPPVAVEPPVVVPPPPAPTTADYVVVKGDTLAKIAKKNHVTVKAMQTANPGVVPTKLKVGQKLVVPRGTSAKSAAPEAAGVGSGSETYVVKSGDNLMKVAKAHGTTVKAIQAENNLTTTRINVGQKLKIPTKATAASAAPVPESVPAVPAPSMPATTPAPEPAK
jgi:LysM repeat protein